MYKLPEDIKEEHNDIKKLTEYFKLKDNYTGPYKSENELYKLKGIFKNGLPQGLIIVENKITKTELHSNFNSNGLPYGDWILYKKDFKNNALIEVKRKKYNF